MSKNTKVTIYILSAFQICNIGYGLYLIRMADLAMDKSGIGDVNLWSEYNSEAGVVFSVSVILWAFTLTAVILSKQYMSLSGKGAVLMPPALFFIGWSALWWV